MRSVSAPPPRRGVWPHRSPRPGGAESLGEEPVAERRRPRPPRAAALVVVLTLLVVAGGRPRQAAAAEIDRLVEVLRLEPGMTVADVGAGDGKWSVLLARYLGKRGRVWATEIDPAEIEEIEARAHRDNVDNITVVLGSQSDLGLPPECCDAVLLRMVYHHFTRPAEMRSGLRRALRPLGLVAIVDIVPQESWRQLPEVPERGGHGIPIEDLVAEMTADGFVLVELHETWNGDEDRYCAVFRR